jgi:hypothetical protein
MCQSGDDVTKRSTSLPQRDGLEQFSVGSTHVAFEGDRLVTIGLRNRGCVGIVISKERKATQDLCAKKGKQQNSGTIDRVDTTACAHMCHSGEQRT